MATQTEVERSIAFVEEMSTAEDRAEMRHWQALADLAAAAGQAGDVAACREMVVVICQNVYIREQRAAARKEREMTEREWAADQAQAIADFTAAFDAAMAVFWALKMHPCLSLETRQIIHRTEMDLEYHRANAEANAEEKPERATGIYSRCATAAAEGRDMALQLAIQQRKACNCKLPTEQG